MNLGEGGGSRAGHLGHGAIGAWYTQGLWLRQNIQPIKSTQLLFPLFPYGNVIPQSICD